MIITTNHNIRTLCLGTKHVMESLSVAAMNFLEFAVIKKLTDCVPVNALRLYNLFGNIFTL